MRRLYVLFVCLFSLHAAVAQEQNQEERAKIKEIKLSGNYYFADVTMDKVKDALELAFRNLVLGIQADLSVGKEIEPRVKEKWQHITLQRAGKQWVFAYIFKGDVDDKFKEETKAGETIEKKDSVAVTPVGQDTVADIPMRVVVCEVDTTERVAEEATIVPEKRDTIGETGEKTVALSGIQRVTDTVVVVQKDTVVVCRRDTIVVREVVKEERNRTTGNPVLDKILTFTKIDELQRYFVQKKEEGKLMFGKMSTAVTPEKCYLVIFSRTGEVVAILDKGTTTRRNLTRGTEGDRADNYEGLGKVWFQLY